MVLVGIDDLLGIDEARECLRTVPASRAYECASALLSKTVFTSTGERKQVQRKLPFSLEVKMNPLWLAIGFFAGWILRGEKR